MQIVGLDPGSFWLGVGVAIVVEFFVLLVIAGVKARKK
jgi:hypothetical protein